MPAIAGVRLATAAAGIKYANRTDVLLAVLDPGTVATPLLHNRLRFAHEKPPGG